MFGTHFLSKPIRSGLLLAAVLGMLVTTAHYAQAQNLTTLYSFAGKPDGANPMTGVLLDAQGNLYGTTALGGGVGCYKHNGCGMAFKLTPDGIETVLAKFTAKNPSPSSGLIWDSQGNLDGTTSGYNGRTSANGGVFELKKKKKGMKLTPLYAFSGSNDGSDPEGGLVMDGQGNLYGTTYYGGASFYGTVFELTPAGTETVLFSFPGGSGGANPYGNLTRDADGNLYGITIFGGGTACGASNGCGTVFKVTPGGSETVLYSFTGGADGWDPEAGLVLDAQGNLYGTTALGGGTSCLSGSRCGTVFKLIPAGTETVLYRFAGGSDGSLPTGRLVFDKAGNLYGTTLYGGGSNCDYGCGTIFKLTPAGVETVLYRFTGGADGANPVGGLVLDAQGNLYGTTEAGGRSGCGGRGCGTVFRLTP